MKHPIDLTNQRFVADLLLRDPETNKELRPIHGLETGPNGEMILIVETSDFRRRWKHTITTEEMPGICVVAKGKAQATPTRPAASTQNHE